VSARSVKELADIPFTGKLTDAFGDYTAAAMEFVRQLRFELDVAARDSQAGLERAHAKWWNLGIDARVRARLVARRLKRAREMADGMEHELQMFWAEYQRLFLDF
jgi:hypothetical protein